MRLSKILAALLRARPTQPGKAFVLDARKAVVALSLIGVLSLAALAVRAQPPAKPAGDQGGPAQPPRGRFEMPRMPLMQALDSDGNGEVSAEEMAAASQALKKLDKNGDGKVDREELRPQFGGPGLPGGDRRGPAGPGARDERGGNPPRDSGRREPFGQPGPGGPGRGEGRGPDGRGQAGTFSSTTLPKDDEERKIVEGIEDIVRKQGRRLNVPTQDGRLLRLLAESIGAKTIVEFGTSNGISAIWMSLALRKTDGKLITHEIDPKTAALARENFKSVGVDRIVTVVEGDGHEKAAELKGPIDLVFIDADKEGYLDYFKKTLPLVRAGGLICAHNMNTRQADSDFVKAITTDPNVETMFYFEGGGMSVTMKKR